MTDRMMPAFWKAPEQGALIGRLLAGYGELEFEMGRCLGVTTRGDPVAGVRELFSERGEKDRIHKARKGMVPEYERIGLRKECETALGDMEWCRNVRNQYAHCHWYYEDSEGLGFVNLEEVVNVPGQLMAGRRMLNLVLLVEQEAFFRYVQRSFWYLEAMCDKSLGKMHNKDFLTPLKRLSRPKKHL